MTHRGTILALLQVSLCFSTNAAFAQQSSTGTGLDAANAASKAFVDNPATWVRSFPPDADNPSNWIVTPGGWMVHPACFHVLAGGDTVDASGNVIDKIGNRVGTLPKCTHPRIRAINSGSSSASLGGSTTSEATSPGPCPSGGACWVEDDWVWPQTFGGQSFFNDIFGYFEVPLAPYASNEQLVYIFNSLQSFNVDPNGIIIQPVLQWGSTCAGNFWCNLFGQGNGGNYWQVADWIVGGNFGTVETSPLQVNPGDYLWGQVEMTTSTQYRITIDDMTLGIYWWLAADLTGNNSSLVFGTAQPAVLEAYNVNACDEYPSSEYDNGVAAVYHGVQIYQGGPNWNTRNAVATDSTAWQQDVTSGLSPFCGYGLWNTNNYWEQYSCGSWGCSALEVTP